MAQTTPPTITAAPSPAPDRSARSTFSGRVDAFVTWISAAVAQFAAVATNVYNNAVDAYNSAVASASSASASATSASASAVSASASSVASNAVLWVSGATVTQYSNVISPTNAKTYRRKTATGSGTTDPISDPTNYEQISGITPGLTFLGVITPTAAANVDFLTTFNAAYDNYLILIDSVKPAADATLSMRLAVAGVADAGANYTSGATYFSLNTTGIQAAGVGICASVTITNANATSGIKGFHNSAIYQRSGDGIYNERVGNTAYTAANAVTGFRLFWQSATANFATTGTVRVYGYQNS